MQAQKALIEAACFSLQIHSVAVDGNCLFNAVSLVLAHDGVRVSPAELRALVLRQALDPSFLSDPTVIVVRDLAAAEAKAMGLREHSFEACTYIRHFAKEGLAVPIDVVDILAVALKRPIWLTMTTEQNFLRDVQPECVQCPTSLLSSLRSRIPPEAAPILLANYKLSWDPDGIQQLPISHFEPLLEKV